MVTFDLTGMIGIPGQRGNDGMSGSPGADGRDAVCGDILPTR